MLDVNAVAVHSAVLAALLFGRKSAFSRASALSGDSGVEWGEGEESVGLVWVYTVCGMFLNVTRKVSPIHYTCVC